MSIIEKISSENYLLSTNEKFKYWYVYLPFFGILVFLAFAVSIFFKRQDDYKVKKPLERQILWTYLIFGFLGLASIFARSQNLPVFGSRIFTFAIIILFLITNVWLGIYFFRVTKKQQLEFAQKKRKEKWLKKK
jgi:cell division protein FtsW (lipid II flippase)